MHAKAPRTPGKRELLWSVTFAATQPRGIFYFTFLLF
jgi:hypothetical protein